MSKHRKALGQFLGFGVLAGVLWMGIDGSPERRVATAMPPEESEKAPVLDKGGEELNFSVRPDRILM